MTTNAMKNLELEVRQAGDGHPTWKVTSDERAPEEVVDPRVEVHMDSPYLRVCLIREKKNKLKIEVITPMLGENYCFNTACNMFNEKRYDVFGTVDTEEVVLMGVPQHAAHIENTLRDIEVAFEKLVNIWEKYNIDYYIDDLRKLRL